MLFANRSEAMEANVKIGRNCVQNESTNSLKLNIKSIHTVVFLTKYTSHNGKEVNAKTKQKSKKQTA